MTFEEAAGQELEWRQPAVRRTYELTLEGRQIAALRFENSYGSRAAGECGSSKWTFKRSGFLAPKVHVRESGSETDLAVFTPGWNGSGWVVFTSGRRYRLRHTNFWGTQWLFEAEDGAVAVTLSGHQGIFKEGGTATIAPSGAALPETPVMLLLIWYLRVLMNADAGAAVVAAT